MKISQSGSGTHLVLLTMIKRREFFLVFLLVLCRLTSGIGKNLPPHPQQSDSKQSPSSTGKRLLEIGPPEPSLPFERFRRSFTQHEPRERKVTSFKPLRSQLNQIEIFPKLSHVGSKSVKLSWIVTPTDSLKHFNVQDETIGLKVKYRPFGSTVERELIFVIEKEALKGSLVENSYDADNLIPGSGYIFCFSLVDQQEILGALENNEYSHVSTTERNHGFSKETEADFPDDASKEIVTEGEHETTTQENIHINTPETDILPPYKPTEPSTVASPTTTEFVPVFINHPGAFADRPPPPSSRGSYAYTSTGDLVYVPGNAWSPRDKRSLRLSGIPLKSSSNEFCTEIFTREETQFVSWNPFVILVALLIVFGVLVSLAIIYCLRLCLSKGLRLPKCLKNKLKPSIPKATPCKIEDTEHSETDTNGNEHDDNISKFQCHCRNSSLPSYQEILSRHERRENMKGTIQIRKNKSFDNLQFHPGYDVPPMSTNEVYGYDIPKFANRGPRSIPTPSSYSCDLNDSEPEFSWTGRNLDNMDTSSSLKHSEGYKKIGPEEVFRSSNNIAPPPLLPRARHKSITELNVEQAQTEITEDLPLYRYTSRGSSISPEVPQKPPRGDEVTVTGGTLIEVPQGYIVPGQNKNLRLIVNTKPVFL